MEEYRFKDERIDKVLTTAESANDYYDFLVKTGYGTDDITVIMSKAHQEDFMPLMSILAKTGVKDEP